MIYTFFVCSVSAIRNFNPLSEKLNIGKTIGKITDSLFDIKPQKLKDMTEDDEIISAIELEQLSLSFDKNIASEFFAWFYGRQTFRSINWFMAWS